MSVYVFPYLIMLESLGASIVYFTWGDWRRGIYWAAAAIITFSVTI